MFEVNIESDFNFLSDEYIDLFNYSSATAFQHPSWLHALYGRLVPCLNAKPLIVTVRDRGTRQLAMMLPLVRQRYGPLRMIEFADMRVSDYATPIASATTFNMILSDESACRAIREALKPFDLLLIKKLPAGSLPIEELLDFAPRASMAVSSHAVALEPNFDNWRERKLNPSYRKELDKKSRQLHRKGRLAFQCVTDVQAIKATLGKMREYRRPRFEGRKDGDIFQKDTYFEFYLDVATRSGGEFARVYSMTLDGVPIATVMGLSHRDKFLVILGGFEFANYKNQSVGSLMFEQVARDCIERGDRELDFTIGDEPYKGLFGAEASSLNEVSGAGSPVGAFVILAAQQAPWLRTIGKRLLRRKTSLGTSSDAGPAPNFQKHSV